MEFLKKSEIDKGLSSSNRVYLCGNLQKESKTEFIRTDNYELGISRYSEYTFEQPHYHSENYEYNYVINGQIKVFLIAEKKEMLFETGDLFVISPNEVYVCKAKPNTCVIFSKVPGGNDKVLIKETPAIIRWGENWDREYEE